MAMSSSSKPVALLLGDKFPDFEAETTQVIREQRLRPRSLIVDNFHMLSDEHGLVGLDCVGCSL